MGHPMRLAGIGGQDQRHALFTGRDGGKAGPCRDAGHAGLNAFRVGRMGGTRELQVGIGRRGFLERDHARADAAVHLGQGDVHGKVGRRKAAVRTGPCGAVAGGMDRLKHRHARRVQGRAVRRAGRKGGGVDDGRRRQRGQHPAQPGGGGFVLEAGKIQAHRAKARVFETADQRCNASGICRRQPCAIERHRDQRPVPRGHPGQRAAVGVPEAEGRQRRRPRHLPRAKPRCPRQFRQRGLRRDLTPGIAEGGQAAQGGMGQGGCGIQRRVGAAVGGQDRQRDTPVPRQPGGLFHAIGPPRCAADQPDQDAPGMGQRAVDIGIDRQRMRQRRQIGQPQARQTRAAPPPARRESAQIAVGKGQHHQIRGRLPQILRRRCFFQPVAFAEQDVHQASAARTAAASRSPFSAITTSRPCRGCAPQGRSN